MRLRPVRADSLELTPPSGQLHLAGVIPPRPRLAIVGARAAVASLRRFVPALVQAAAEEGWAVLSGGARGIDGDAHRAALAAEVPQLVVLPGPPGSLYPAEHAALFRSVVASGVGGLLYPHPKGTTYSRGMFASRNRVVVLLADRVVVVQAALRSGTLHTARAARQHGRPLAALPGSPGAAACIATGAFAVADPQRDELADATARMAAWLRGESVPARSSPWPPVLGELRRALERAGPRGVTAADFADPAGATVTLALAEARRLVLEVAPGRYVAAAGS